MPAISTQYTFDLTISVPDLNRVIEHRLRVSHSVNDLLERTYAKVLAFCHSYQPELQLSSGGDPLEPALFCRNLTGDITVWIDVGCPSLKKLNKPVRSHGSPKVKIYFYRDSHPAEFKSEFHGYKAEYLKDVEGYQFDSEWLINLGRVVQRSSVWNITFMDNSIYLDANGESFSTELKAVDLGALVRPASFVE